MAKAITASIITETTTAATIITKNNNDSGYILSQILKNIHKMICGGGEGGAVVEQLCLRIDLNSFTRKTQEKIGGKNNDQFKKRNFYYFLFKRFYLISFFRNRNFFFFVNFRLRNSGSLISDCLA